jgi:hypothetical protein
MGGFNVSHGLFVSALFADEILKRLWKLTIAFFICPVKPKVKGEGDEQGYCQIGSKE